MLPDKCRGCYHCKDACLKSLDAGTCGEGADPENGYAPLVGDHEQYEDWLRKKGLAHVIDRAFGGRFQGNKFVANKSILQEMAGLTPGSRLYKAMEKKAKSQPGKAAATKKPSGSQGAAHSPLVREVRERMTRHPHKDAVARAQKEGGGSTHHFSKLAQAAGVSPSDMKKLAIDSNHSTHFVEQVRSTYGDKVKDLSDGQIRSSYHSTGLRHSMTEGDLEKAVPHGFHPKVWAHAVKDAKAQKKWAASVKPAWHKQAGIAAKEYHAKVSNSSVHDLAVHTHNYLKYRAHLFHGALDTRPTDPIAHELWTKLTGRAPKPTKNNTKKSEETMDDLEKCNDRKKTKKLRRTTPDEVTKGLNRKKTLQINGAAQRAKGKLCPKCNKEPAHPMFGICRACNKKRVDSLGKSEVTLVEILDLIVKSESCCKHGKAIGHTSTGKPIHADGRYYAGFNKDEHLEAEELHDTLASKFGQAASRWGNGANGNSPLPPASRKYVQQMADHHRGMARGHYKLAYPPSQSQVINPVDPNEGIPAHFGFGETKKSEFEKYVGQVPQEISGYMVGLKQS